MNSVDMALQRLKEASENLPIEDEVIIDQIVAKHTRSLRQRLHELDPDTYPRPAERQDLS